MLILNSPHNPTGKVFTKEELHFIAECCEGHDLVVITDEIYEHMLYGNSQHHCLVTLDGMREHTIVLNSISKTRSCHWLAGGLGSLSAGLHTEYPGDTRFAGHTGAHTASEGSGPFTGSGRRFPTSRSGQTIKRNVTS